MKRLRWLGEFVKKTSLRTTNRARRLIASVVCGMLIGGSVVLSDIARSLEPTKKRFWRLLNWLSETLADESVAFQVSVALRDHVQDAARETGREYNFVAVGISDIVKKYGRKMPRLCTVRDGSESRPGEPKLKRGWWLIEIIATASDHRVLQLLRQPWSTKSPEFRSENVRPPAENNPRVAVQADPPSTSFHRSHVVDFPCCLPWDC